MYLSVIREARTFDILNWSGDCFLLFAENNMGNHVVDFLILYSFIYLSNKKHTCVVINALGFI